MPDAQSRKKFFLFDTENPDNNAGPLVLAVLISLGMLIAGALLAHR